MPSKPMLSEEDKAEIRKRLKALCEGRWIARGYKRTSVKELCAAAGISIGTFYVLYPSKEDLFLETIRDIQERLKEQVLETNRRERSRGGFARALKELYREYAAKPFLYNVGTPDFRSFAAKLPEEAAQQIKLDSFAFFRQAVQAAGLRLRQEESLAYGALSALLSTVSAREALSAACDPSAVFGHMAEVLMENLFEEEPV